MEDPVEGNSQTQEPRQENFTEDVRMERDGQDEEQDQVNIEYHGQDGIQQDNQPHEPPDEAVDQFSSFIKLNLYDLLRMISTQFGLLDDLLEKEVLTPDQIELIKRKGKRIGEAKQLFEEISSKPMSAETKEKFFDSLDQTQHKHVSNFIRGNAVRAAEYGDDWPLFCIREEVRRFQTNRKKLNDSLDCKHGLLDEMLATTRLNNQQKQSIMAGSTDREKNESLIQLILRSSIATNKAFIDCLLTTKQHLVVSLLQPSLVGDIHPLTDDQQSRLMRNYPELLRIITTNDGLIAELVAADCITWRQREYVEQSTIIQTERNERLLDIILKGPETNFHKLIECLNKTGQQHVSSLLIKDDEDARPPGAVARIVATTSPVNNREQQEIRIVDRLRTIILIRPNEPELIAPLRRHFSELNEHEISMVEANIGHSIGLFYFTRSLRGLQYLRDIFDSEQLKSTVQEIFIMLLKADGAEETLLDLCVDTLRWDLSNYFDCLLCTLVDLPILSHIYGMASQNKQHVSMCSDVRALPIDQLPFELIEILLIRTTCHLFVTINRTTPARAKIYTLATMMAVSYLWWEALTQRKYIRRLLKRLFKRVCYPFECSPRQVITLHHIAGDKDVRGVAVLKNELYVACAQSNTIQVFDSKPPFTRRGDIKVLGFKDATDITVCSKSSQLYIADFTERAIWRVNLLSLNPADKFLTNQWQPWSLSVNSSRLLVTPFDGDSLFLYGDDGKEIRHIELPRYMDAHNGVETTRNTYIIGHSNRFIVDSSSDRRYNVTEVDIKGQVVRTFNSGIDSIYFKEPCYLVLDNDHLIVTDRDNERIILMDSNLQFKRVLVNELQGKQPRRLCLTSSRLLVIGYLQSTDIDIFQV